MKDLTLLQQLQSVKPIAKIQKEYTVYHLEEEAGVTKIGIPSEKVDEFDTAIAQDGYPQNVAEFIAKYDGVLL